jgi:hypothetical protein
MPSIALVLALLVAPADDAGWTPLFNGRDLDGWYTFLQKHGRDNDPDRVITIEDGAIHLYKHAEDGAEVVMGYIGTLREYGDYHLRWKFRWGPKKFKPRYELKRDAGVYYHIQGGDQVWPRALQYQVEQTNVGDLIALYGMAVDSWVDPRTVEEAMPTFLDPAEGGVARVLGGKGIAYQKHLAGDWEVEGWNTGEIIARGDTVVHKLNGRVVNRGTGVRLVDEADPSRSTPITRGRIALEIEAAELWFKDVEIRDLSGEPAGGDGLKVGAAAVELEADDSLVIGGGIGPGKATGQEGKLRAAAVVIEAPSGRAACLVACDVLMLDRDILDAAARGIEARTGIPFHHVLINCTHTHHAPTTVTVHGYEREEGFARQVGEKIVEAAVKAHERRRPARFDFRLGEESSVGQNSRLLLADGTIFWVGSREDAVRPTGPFDPELPVLAFRRVEDEGLEALLFNHSTHTIGTLTPGVRSPSFYGLAAQELEERLGGTVIFFEGASGSTHNLTLDCREMVHRVREAVRDALAKGEPRPLPDIRGLRQEVTLRYRRFDEAAEDAAVSAYCTKRQPAPWNETTIAVFRAMRQALAPLQGMERKTWVQAIALGDVAIVGVPAEFFTVLGQEIKRRSPFRYTYIFELANDYVGYTPDREAFEKGGYQTWTGLHSSTERDSGAILVEEAVGLLKRLAAPAEPEACREE